MTTTVDDVQYLTDRGEKESYLLLVDSSKRDILTWPTPSEYEIRFETPFRQVYGIDVIDATVPRTQYNVETFNNTLHFSIWNGVQQTIKVEAADYEVKDLITEINNAFSGNIVVGPAFKYDSRTETRSLKEKLSFRSQFKFSFFESPMSHVLGFGKSSYIATRTDAATSNITELGIGSSLTAVPAGTWVRQQFSVNQAYPMEISSISLECETVISNTTIRYRIIDMNATQIFPPSGYVSFVKASTARQVLKILIQDDSVQEFSPGTYFIEFSTLPDSNGVLVYTTGSGTNGILENNTSTNGRLNIGIEAFTYVLEAPHLYDLVGDRYLQIRCKEIEQYMFRTRAYEKFNAGLAKVQLGVFGYENARFDYSSFPPREFHPIGKLGTLTFRFERPDGTLYDFKGIDHTMTLVVRYLKMKNPTFNTQILNPAYNANLLEYENENPRGRI
jgi:hypothetical protein